MKFFTLVTLEIFKANFIFYLSLDCVIDLTYEFGRK